jgi:hypothetical protein
MIKLSPFVKAVERALSERCKYSVYLGEVTIDNPPMPYALVGFPKADYGSATTLDNVVSEISFLQPVTVVASTADRLLVVLDDVRASLEGYELQVGRQHCEPLTLEYCSAMLRDNQVNLPGKKHPMYAVDMWRIRAVNRFH